MLVLFEPGPDIVQAGTRLALMVGCLGTDPYGDSPLGHGLFHTILLAAGGEIATTNSVKVSLELVNRELGHRVGNLLALAQALVWLTYEASLSTAEFRDSSSIGCRRCINRWG